MDKERNLGVTEARFALTILTCLLVAIGYIALLRLGGAKDNSSDVGPEEVSPPSIVDRVTPPPSKGDPDGLRVVPLERPDEIAKRPTSGQQLQEPERR